VKQIARPEKVAQVELWPELDACIETQAKREYNRVLGELLSKGEDQGLAQRHDILKRFLESADFNKLRRESEKHLILGKRVKFVVRLKRGRPEYEMKVEEAPDQESKPLA